MNRSLAVAGPAVLVAVLAAGCLGPGTGRSEWAFDDTGLDGAAALGRTGAGVTVALLDTGINTRHPSMDHLRDGDKANGELVGFRDFLGSAQGADSAFDDDGHGTHVAGILVAQGSTGLDKFGGIDLRGGAPNVLLLAARVCAGDTCDANVLPEAIDWAVAQGADVVSLSLGGRFGLRDIIQENAIEQSVAHAVDSGVVVIASAGNGGQCPDTDPGEVDADVQSPGSLRDVIAVGAVGHDGQVACFSTRGDDGVTPCLGFDVPRPPPLPTLPVPPPVPLPTPGRCYPDQKPELVAPGVGILSAWTKDDYVRADGTSQATPFVTAAVALMLEGKPDLSGRAAVEQVKLVLVETARPVPGQAEPHDEAAGYGLLQAEAAIRLYG